MTPYTLIVLARKHLGGPMESSARLALADAITLYNDGRHDDAGRRALTSLRYSRGAGVDALLDKEITDYNGGAELLAKLRRRTV